MNDTSDPGDGKDRARGRLPVVPKVVRLGVASLLGVAIGLAVYAGVRSQPTATASPSATPVIQGDLTQVRTSRPGIRVLFVGNSFTAANSMISTLAHMTTAGFRAATPIFAVQYAPGGSTLAEADQDPRLKALIAGTHWDDVVLQEQSQIPEMPASQDPEQYGSLPAARQLGRAIRADGARAWVFETWGYLHGDPANVRFDSYGNMQKRLRAGYLQLAAAAHATIAPVGEAWQRAIANQPDLELWASDGIHPSPEGSYLTASVFYGLLEHTRPVNSEYNGALDATTAVHLRQDAGDPN